MSVGSSSDDASGSGGRDEATSTETQCLSLHGTASLVSPIASPHRDNKTLWPRGPLKDAGYSLGAFPSSTSMIIRVPSSGTSLGGDFCEVAGGDW